MPDPVGDPDGGSIVIGVEVSTLRRTLTGSFDAGGTIVLTPIPAIHARFREHGWSPAEQGWWPRLERDGCQVILIPQGSAVRDVSATVSDARSVEFLGYAGSLRGEYDVGAIVRPSTAVLGDDLSTAEPLRGGDTDAVVATVPSVLTTYEQATRLAPVAGLADMECAHLAAALRTRSGPTPSARLLVTDRWPDAPFYGDGALRGTRLRAARDELVDTVAGTLS